LNVKAVGIIGFKKSGKTTLGNRLSRALSNKGLRVAVFKNVAHHDVSTETDTGKYREHAHFVAAVSSEGVSLFLRGARSIEEVLAFSESDVVLVEGFKQEKTYPKIICLRDKGEEEDLFDGLQLFTAGFQKGLADFEIDNDAHVEKMADRVIEKAFKLPALNCGRCGLDSCYDLARVVVKGEKSPEACVFLNASLSLQVDGKAVSTEDFSPDILRKAFLSLLPSLKNCKGEATISILIP